MKIFEIGGSEHEAIAASLDTMTGQAPAEALVADIVADADDFSLVPNAAYRRLGRFVP